jgi:ABC-type transport system involved in multi-copper enzyme maturation permease subunit
MLTLIIKKELLENLVSYKFILITIACFVLLGFCNYAMYKNYQKNLEDYNLSFMQAGNALIRKPPSVLSIYVNGVQDLLERTFMYQRGAFEPMDINFLNFNFYRQLFPVLDFAYLVKVVLSFLAMILGFDLFCGEKVRGTLRLMLGNSVSRNTIILGKILGNYLAFVIPFLVAFLSYFIILQDFENKMVAQALVATATAMLSPYASFTLAGNELAATGIANQIHFNQQRQQYEQAMWDYIKQRQQEEYAKDKTVNDRTQLDLSGRPKFEYKDVPFKLRIIAAAVPTLFLVIFNLLFFVLAFRGVLRYDVR